MSTSPTSLPEYLSILFRTVIGIPEVDCKFSIKVTRLIFQPSQMTVSNRPGFVTRPVDGVT